MRFLLLILGHNSVCSASPFHSLTFGTQSNIRRNLIFIKLHPPTKNFLKIESLPESRNLPLCVTRSENFSFWRNFYRIWYWRHIPLKNMAHCTSKNGSKYVPLTFSKYTNEPCLSYTLPLKLQPARLLQCIVLDITKKSLFPTFPFVCP